MTDHDALLRAVLINPADDMARLVYADKLDELDNGNSPEAEFIRLHIELAKAPQDDKPYFSPVSGLPRMTPTLRERVVELWHSRPGYDGIYNRMFFTLLAQVGRDVAVVLDGTADLRSDVVHRVVTGEFPGAIVRRGFVEELHCTLTRFLDVPCRRCGGRLQPMHIIEVGNIQRCNHCKGTGTETGMARPLFGRHPITRVRFVDAVATQFDDMLFWLDIPDELKPFLPGEPDAGYPQNGISADDAISLAGANFGRNLHGLPLLGLEHLYDPE